MLLGVGGGERQRGGAGHLSADPELGQPLWPAWCIFPMLIAGHKGAETHSRQQNLLCSGWPSSPCPDCGGGDLQTFESKPHGRALPYQRITIAGKVNLQS